MEVEETRRKEENTERGEREMRKKSWGKEVQE